MAQTEKISLPAQTQGGGDSTTDIGVIGSVEGTNNDVTKVTLVPPSGFSTVAGDNTNSVSFTVGYRRAGANTVLATKQLVTGESLVAQTPYNVPITAAHPDACQPGDLLYALMHQVGTGIAVGAGVQCEVDIA